MTGKPPSRIVEPRKTRRALSKLKRAVERAEATGAPLSAWENEFAQSVQERLETFGSAFTDPAKGALDEPLSARQARKVKEIAKKATRNRLVDTKPAKPRKPLKRTPWRSRRRPPPTEGEGDDV